MSVLFSRGGGQVAAASFIKQFLLSLRKQPNLWKMTKITHPMLQSNKL